MSLSSRPTTIPPSPTSPPQSGLKRRRLSDNLPQSPISPSFMSVATKSYVSSYENTHNTEDAAGRSTPSSPRGHGPQSQQASRPTHSLPTPAHSIVGINSGFDMVDEGDHHRDKRAKLDSGNDEDSEQAEVEPNTQDTNHDRNDEMEVDSKEAIADSGSAAGLLSDVKILDHPQEDMGDAFLLCRSKVERQQPNPQQHLLALYGLGSLLRSVARTDPRTGEKINKLRKSYEGQIKGFNLSGRNKPVKGERNTEEDQPGPLRRIIGSSPWGLQPEDEWSAEHANSKIEVAPDLRAKMKEAMTMQTGTVRNNAHWEDVMGLENRGAIAPRAPQVQSQHQPPLPRQMPNGAVRSFQQSAEAKRQTRGKKRSYGDDSFVGYGEGYSDQEDGDEYSQRKRQKKLGVEY